MKVRELMAKLEGKDSEDLILVDREHHGWWSLEPPDELQCRWVVMKNGDYESVEEGTPGAVRGWRVI